MWMRYPDIFPVGWNNPAARSYVYRDPYKVRTWFGPTGMDTTDKGKGNDHKKDN